MRPSYSSVGSPQSRPNPQHLSSSSILRDDPVFDFSTSTCISLAYSNVQLSSDHLAHPHPPSDILTSSSGYPSLSSQTFVSNLDSSTRDSAKTVSTLELRCPVLAAVVPTPPPTPIWPVSMEEEGQEHEGLHDTHVETNRIEHLQIDRSQNEQQQPSCSLSCSPFKVCQSLCLIGTPSTGLSGHNLLQSQQPVPPSLCNLDERTSRTEEMAPIGLSSNCLQFPEFTRLESASALTDLDGKIASRQTASSQLPAHSTHSAHPALDCLQTTAVTNSLTNMRRSRRNVTFQQFWTPKPSRRKRKGEQTILQTVGTGRQTEPAACFPSPQLHNIGLA
ncbi:unnamed protein product [Protopolystoma xenopodis]|uniref:Uncharacterized protein n=1 Tax=Protopolystoma xenopodis TaxID=117903 RepID=A0A3S5AGR4_9PLAT|nr:unnamed protein product [Protopolystoma xenopodis]